MFSTITFAGEDHCFYFNVMHYKNTKMHKNIILFLRGNQFDIWHIMVFEHFLRDDCTLH